MKAAPNNTDFIARLDALIAARAGESPRHSYVAKLLAAGEDAVLGKVSEEADELVRAVKAADREQVLHEAADLWFHTMVLLAQQGLSAGLVIEVLERRFGHSGLAEKARRGKDVGADASG